MLAKKGGSKSKVNAKTKVSEFGLCRPEVQAIDICYVRVSFVCYPADDFRDADYFSSLTAIWNQRTCRTMHF